MIAAKPPCRPEVGSGVAPRRTKRPNYLVLDLTFRCGGEPVIVFEVPSPSDADGPARRDHRRSDRPRAALRLESLAVEMRLADFYFGILDPFADFEDEEVSAGGGVSVV